MGKRGKRGRVPIDVRWNPYTSNRISRNALRRSVQHEETLTQRGGDVVVGNKSGVESDTDLPIIPLQSHFFDGDDIEGSLDDGSTRTTSGTANDDLQDREDPGPEQCPEDDVMVMEDGNTESILPPHQYTEVAPLQLEGLNSSNVLEPSRLSAIRPIWQKLCRWQNIFGFMLLNGTGRLSVQQYDIVESVINFFLKERDSRESPLPCSSTIRRTVQPVLQQWSFVSSALRTAEVDANKSGAPRSHTANETGKDVASFIVVVPSAWSVMDVSFQSTWEILKQAALRKSDDTLQPVFRDVECIPMVTIKDNILNVAQAILPTKLTPRVDPSPLLLAERSVKPFLTIYLNRDTPFPPEAIGAIRGACEESRKVVIQSECVKSIIVDPRKQQDGDTRMHDTARRTDIMNGCFSALTSPTWNLWKPGDVCTLLRMSTGNEFIFVLVQQHLRRPGVSQVMELLYIPLEETTGDGEMCRIRFDRTIRDIVLDIAVSAPDLVSRGLSERTEVPSFGTLKDGRLYFVDNILLYSDGFSQYNFKQGSAGGVYALSLNYPAELRRSRERVRVIALTPPGVSTMEGIRAVIEDLVKASTTGVEVRNGDGQNMILFTNVVGYVADYHETGHALDVVGQNGSAPCHLCTFLRYNGHPSTASRYAYTSLIHSSDTCYSRMAARTECVRASAPADVDLVSIGLNRDDDALRKDSPLHELSRRLKAAVDQAEIPLTTLDIPVVNPMFDPYRSVLVSPDHVLFGITSNALNFAFAVLPSQAQRKQDDALISESLHSNGLSRESQIFNLKKSMLHNTSISIRFCTLLVSPDIFKELWDSCRRCGGTNIDLRIGTISVENLAKLRDLVRATYWFPNSTVDGSVSVKSFNCNRGRVHLTKLERMCEDYIGHINDICKISQEARRHLDKPNVHRMLELYKHSIPAMGHVRHFAELVFETAHQPLKRAMLRSNFRESHIQSSMTCIADDWKRRLQEIVTAPSTLSQNEPYISRQRELIKLLCGRRDNVADVISSEPHLLSQTSSVLHSKPLKAILNSKPSKLNGTKSFTKWTLSKPINGVVDTCATTCSLSDIRTLVDDFLVYGGNHEIRCFSRASRTIFSFSAGRLCASNPYQHDVLCRSNVLQAWVDDIHAPCLVPSEQREKDDDTTLSYFAVEMFLNIPINESNIPRTGLESYAAVRLCTVTESGFLRIDTRAHLQLLILTNSTRRVGITHACENDSTMKCSSVSPTWSTCNASIFGGNEFYYYGRDRGYPPRMA